MTVDLHDDLAEFIAGEDAPDEPPPPPEDADEANRLLRRLRSFERRRDEILDHAKAEIDRITDWRADRVAGLDRSIEFHARALEGWMRSHHAATGVKTENLPNGVARIRAAKSSVAVLDQEKAATVVEALGLPVGLRRTVEVDKRDLLGALFVGSPVAKLPDASDSCPPGYQWREALAVVAFEVVGFVFVPFARVVPDVLVLHPTQPSFGYTTSKETRG